MSRRRFPGYYVIREYGHRMPTQYAPIFVASRRRAEWLRDWYDDEMRARYCTAFYAYVICADELAAAQAEAHDHARYPDDPRHSPLTVERAPRGHRL
jgi:hypothetical protein